MAPSTPIISKIKVHLKLAISRLRIVQHKDTALAKQQRREMAHLLEQGKVESARIRVENIIRSDLITELLEILELYCELLLARIGLMEPQTVDPGLEEAVRSIMYAAPRTEIKELQQCRMLLAEKYGKEYTLRAMENQDSKVPERVLRKLRVEPPTSELVESYLQAIANAYDVPYADEDQGQVLGHQDTIDTEDDDEDGDDDQPGSGGQAIRVLEPALAGQDLSGTTPSKDLGPKKPVSIVPPSPTTDNANPKIKLPGPPQPTAVSKKKQPASAETKSSTVDRPSGAARISGPVPDANDLERRFALLKR